MHLFSAVVLSLSLCMLCSDTSYKQILQERLCRKKTFIERTILLTKKLIDIKVPIDNIALANHGYMRNIDPDNGVSMCSIDYKYADLHKGMWMIDRWTREQVGKLLGANLVQRLDGYDTIEFQPINLFYCNWRGIHCEHDAVKEILWRRPAVVIPRIGLQWLPPTATTVHIDEQGVNQMIHTAMLPRALVALRLMRCNLTGTPDFEKLPKRLRELNLQQNRLTGTIWLTNLPQSLSSVDVSGNEIDLLVVSNATLPGSLSRVAFAQYGKEADVRTIDGETNLQLFQVVNGPAKKKRKHPKVH